MRQFEAIAAGWIGCENALKHAALHVKQIVQLLQLFGLLPLSLPLLSRRIIAMDLTIAHALLWRLVVLQPGHRS